VGNVIIIAEAGVNHNGETELAKRLIDAADTAGADFVKFQSFVPELLVSKNAQKADYQKAATGHTESQLDMVRKLSLSPAQHLELREYCKTKTVKFFSTPFDLESIEMLKDLGITIGKIPSGEITNYPYLVKMARTFRSIVMSTGMSDLHEIREALKVLLANGKKLEDVTVLHCNTEYPTPMTDVNLRAIGTIRKELAVNVGYSDHTVGIEIPVAAVALGATVIEKHFTLDRSLPGPDHAASLIPDELKEMVKCIRNIEIAMGSGEKKMTESEGKNRAIARKSIVAKRPISRGELFSEENITAKRPGTGISPMKWNEIIGKKAVRDFEEDELIQL
jgi:N,N'-diacetyllegionaminate synthase